MSKDRDQALLAHVTNIHYSIEQSEYFHDFMQSFRHNTSLLDGLKDRPYTEIKKIMEKLRDFVIGPNLETLSHRNHMFLIGNDFAFTN